MTVDVQIVPEPGTVTGIEFIPDLDLLSEGECSCAAGDDNPF